MSDPRQTIANAPMSRLQIAAVAIAVGLNALDGFDVLSISFASPGIAEEWGIDRVALGIVLSMELVGMAVGSVVLGGLADRIGRRRTMLGCLVAMTLGMAMVPQANDLVSLSVWRVLTGLGIGGILAALGAVTAEFSNDRRKTLALSLMVIGYPMGAVIGGIISAQLLTHFDWRAIFWFGAALTVLFIPLVWFLVPESLQFLLVKRGPDTLGKVNRLLARFGHPPVDTLPPLDEEDEDTAGFADLFKGGMVATTFFVTAAYFAHIVTFYFILKWTPKIIVDLGYPPAQAAGVLVWANVGGAIGGAVFGLVVQKLPLKGSTIFVLLGSSAMVALFGAAGATSLGALSALAFGCGLFINSGISGLYIIFARAFPTRLRATGAGFAIGIGRGGAALSPVIAGILFEAGLRLAVVAIVIAMGSLLGALALAAWRFRPRD